MHASSSGLGQAFRSPDLIASSINPLVLQASDAENRSMHQITSTSPAGYCCHVADGGSGRGSANRSRLGVSKQVEGNNPSGTANVKAASVHLG